MAVLTFTRTTILISYGINTSVVFSNDRVHIRWLSWAHIYGTNMSMVVSKSSMTSVIWRAWMYTMDVHYVVHREQSSLQNTWYAKSCTQHFYHHRFSETWHRLQIILALVIRNHYKPAFCDKGAVVLISNVMATPEVTGVRISCVSYQSNSWPKILVCGTDTPHKYYAIYTILPVAKCNTAQR
jgi:hypothetical protein